MAGWLLPALTSVTAQAPAYRAPRAPRIARSRRRVPRDCL